MVRDESMVRKVIMGLAPKNNLGPHSQFVKGYNRALRDILAAVDEHGRSEIFFSKTKPGGGK